MPRPRFKGDRLWELWASQRLRAKTRERLKMGVGFLWDIRVWGLGFCWDIRFKFFGSGLKVL